MILFWMLNNLLMSVEFPQKITPYDILEWKQENKLILKYMFSRAMVKFAEPNLVIIYSILNVIFPNQTSWSSG
jgi:hypothetical protein